jgi:hypothetical protein
MVLVMRKVLYVWTYMPPADAAAVLPTTREFSTMISTRVLPKIPPAHGKTTTCVSAGTDDDYYSNHSVNPAGRVSSPKRQIMSGSQHLF